MAPNGMGNTENPGTSKITTLVNSLLNMSCQPLSGLEDLNFDTTSLCNAWICHYLMSKSVPWRRRTYDDLDAAQHARQCPFHEVV